MSKENFHLMIIKIVNLVNKSIRKFSERLFRTSTASYSTLIEIDICTLRICGLLRGLYTHKILTQLSRAGMLITL